MTQLVPAITVLSMRLPSTHLPSNRASGIDLALLSGQTCEYLARAAHQENEMFRKLLATVALIASISRSARDGGRRC